ncbi:MAG: hypothetical protein JSV52_05445 [Candidatus Zixiibacteriota bacterium]|nr:MAG: hypothetical protein JSV52_05445 [candidate division Zixibacteria bacterium]
MSLTICIFEDQQYDKFLPLSQLRPVFTLRSGIVPLYERCHRYFPDARIVFSCREQVAMCLMGHERDYPINIIKKAGADILFLNGRIRDYGDLPKLVAESRISTLFKNGEDTVAIHLRNDGIRNVPEVATPLEYYQHLQQEGENIPDFDTTATVYHYCWDIMADIEREIREDIVVLKDVLPKPQNVRIHDGVFWVAEQDVYLGNDVEIMPGAVIDASNGPIYIGPNTRVESHAAIYGPTYVGPNSVVVAGKITSSSIGHTCRVGGEVEHSVFHSYVNKYHAGFIGHSYVGSWVNFGAMTTNSDLKNNYSNIKVSLNGDMIDTGSSKVGSFIGDHTKFGIGMLLNTGINIGISCNIFGGGLVTDREIPPFSWGSTGNFVSYDFRKAIETARVVAARRGYTLSEAEERILEDVSQGKTKDKGVLRF